MREEHKMEKKINENMENMKENMEKNMENVKENLKEKKAQFKENAKTKKYNPKAVYFWLSFIFGIIGLLVASVHYLPETEGRDEKLFYGILGMIASVVFVIVAFLLFFIGFEIMYGW